ncbi:TetR/AcrR family transcriptional regulator [Cryptosporangium phraense]|uniref:TetR/AcrR family transcriptional regulator n=1 Tax=Cryptosporangium phraense TaxID=2593070 RepID=A0A545AI88_9ACTN|nr:TetR/AcrR family transcriptional regulator [Cryptosporangium phraense]
MLAAARELLLRHGPTAVTHQRVAEQAGVGRATVYRHWARTEALLLDAMSGSDLPWFREPRTPVRAWLHRELRGLADEMAQPEVAAVTLTLMHGALWDVEIAKQRDASVANLNDRVGVALRLASESGEAQPAVKPADAAALLIGPLVYRTAMQRGAVPDEVITRAIDTVAVWTGTKLG